MLTGLPRGGVDRIGGSVAGVLVSAADGGAQKMFDDDDDDVDSNDYKSAENAERNQKPFDM